MTAREGLLTLRMEPGQNAPAALLRRLCPQEHADAVAAAAALLCAVAGAGQTRVALAEFAGRRLRLGETYYSLPPETEWADSLLASGLAGDGSTVTPLVLERGEAYFYRYWKAWREVAAGLARRARRRREVGGGLAERFAQLIPPSPGGGSEPQAEAAFSCLNGGLAVISGGPGTGKTTLAKQLVQLLLAENPAARILLAAPTGKAASRLYQAVRGAGESCLRPAATLHRLLEFRPESDRFGRHEGNLLPADAVIVDEASMIGLLLFNGLLKALPETARLVLVGDGRQLASVNAGGVFASLCAGAAGEKSAAFTESLQAFRRGESVAPTGDGDKAVGDAVTFLTRNWRFGAGSGIAAFAQAIATGAADAAELPGAGLPGLRRLAGWDELRGLALAHADACAEADGPEAALARHEDFKILCAVNSGPAGADGINRMVAEALAQRFPAAGRACPGTPLLITANHYGLGLFNGDAGVLWPQDGTPYAWFASENGLRRFALGSLPPYSLSWALTVHKSQGSEYSTVCLVLPEEDSPALSRELLYTGATRARENLCLLAAPQAIAACAARPARSGAAGDALLM